MATPAYVQRFCDVLSTTRLNHIDLPISRPPILGRSGILTTSRLQFNHEPWNLLGRQHEYTFVVGDQALELSMQLYLNVTRHWRLFCYCAQGLLLSVNLTLLGRGDRAFTLSQQLRLTARNTSAAERARRVSSLCAALTSLGLEVSRLGRLVLGSFDPAARAFVDTTPQTFIVDFALASLVKGHFMANKGYRLPGLPVISADWISAARAGSLGRSIPLGLRYQVLARADRRCNACNRGLRDGIRLHVDHIRPYSQGGRTELSNLQALCAPCNLGKGNRFSGKLGSQARSA